MSNNLLLLKIKFFLKKEYTTTTPNNFHFCGMWGDPNVDNFTSTCKFANREIAFNRPT